MPDEGTLLAYAPTRHPRRFRLRAQHIPLLATFAVCLILYTAAAIYLRNRGFFSMGVFISFFSDNAFLGITAVGMTFVILSGGIDLSVGSMVGFTSILIGWLMSAHHVHPIFAIAIALMAGAVLGLLQGALIHFFGSHPSWSRSRGCSSSMDWRSSSAWNPLRSITRCWTGFRSFQSP